MWLQMLLMHNDNHEQPTRVGESTIQNSSKEINSDMQSLEDKIKQTNIFISQVEKIIKAAEGYSKVGRLFIKEEKKQVVDCGGPKQADGEQWEAVENVQEQSPEVLLEKIDVEKNDEEEKVVDQQNVVVSDIDKETITKDDTDDEETTVEKDTEEEKQGDTDSELDEEGGADSDLEEDDD